MYILYLDSFKNVFILYKLYFILYFIWYKPNDILYYIILRSRKTTQDNAEPRTTEIKWLPRVWEERELCAERVLPRGATTTSHRGAHWLSAILCGRGPPLFSLPYLLAVRMRSYSLYVKVVCNYSFSKNFMQTHKQLSIQIQPKYCIPDKICFELHNYLSHYYPPSKLCVYFHYYT